MEIFVLGTSQSVAPASVRERLHVELDDVYDALAPLRNGRGILDEAIPLTTCARLELYGVAPDEDRAAGLLKRLVRLRKGLAHDELEPHAYIHRGDQAVEHLLRVAAGLDSVVHGEAQILGQVRDAAHHPRVGSTEGPVLHRLFQSALTTGKRVRCETEIGRGAASLASASLTLLRRELGSLDSLSALVLGAGDTGGLMARLLTKAGVGRLVIGNRSVDRARALARELEAEACGLDELPGFLPAMDLIVGAVAGSEPILGPDSVGVDPAALSARPRYFVDLAHPRNFDPALGELDNVTIFDLEQVFRRVERAREARSKEVPRAEAIVAEEREKFLRWLRARRNAGVVRAVRGRMMDRAMAEADLHAGKLPPEYREEVRQVARSVARTLLHEPTIALRQADPASDAGREILAGAARLFGLESLAEDPGGQP